MKTAGTLGNEKRVLIRGPLGPPLAGHSTDVVRIPASFRACRGMYSEAIRTLCAALDVSLVGSTTRQGELAARRQLVGGIAR